MRTLAVKSPPPGGAGNLPTGWAASLSSQKITSLAPPASVFTLSWLDGGAQERPVQCVGLIRHEQLETLLGSEQPLTHPERQDAQHNWRKLCRENAPFRVVSPVGLVSASVDHFDPLLIERTTTKWQKIARVIGDTMGHNMEPCYQVSDLMLLTRVVALINEGYSPTATPGICTRVG
jgi:hypothetical protein